ncbi:MAG: restriction endonuclease subunit S [Lentisphaeria bacterium]|nr:restriction endonuclease subunit S [Lentisphaeria bacterium]
MALGEICNILRGKRLTKKELSNDNLYPVFHGGLDPIGFFSRSNRDADTVMVINVGASAGTVGYCNKPFWSSDGCFCLSKSEILNSKYLYYALKSVESHLQMKVRKAGIPTLDPEIIARQTLAIPPLSEQERIVSILDKFDVLVNDLTSGLPAEIAARRRQYEHYRDRLLTFKEIA